MTSEQQAKLRADLAAKFDAIWGGDEDSAFAEMGGQKCQDPQCGCYRAWHNEVGTCQSHIDNDRYCRCKGWKP
jgi:hypothetical protein